MSDKIPFSARLLSALSSAQITVVCLSLLFILTFWGTVAQVSQGLYAAQERFFYSFFFLAGGFFPFPGAQLVLWVMFVNLVASGISHFIHLRHWRYTGLKLSHAGLLIYFIAAYITFHASQEAYIHLAEGEGTNVAASYDGWEVAYWKEAGYPRHITALDANGLKSGDVVNLAGVSIGVEQFFLNCEAFTKTLSADGIKPLNNLDITLLQPKELFKEREKNVAGGMFKVDGQRVLLYGSETEPTKVKDLYFSLRKKTFPLPFTLRLDEFKAEFYPGTQTAKSYESYVSVLQSGSSRRVKIYMNNPLRYKDLTFYQASYDTDDSGRKCSTLAVVRNAGQVLPYVACFAVFFGLVAHFLIAAFEQRLKR